LNRASLRTASLVVPIAAAAWAASTSACSVDVDVGRDRPSAPGASGAAGDAGAAGGSGAAGAAGGGPAGATWPQYCDVEARAEARCEGADVELAKQACIDAEACGPRPRRADALAVLVACAEGRTCEEGEEDRCFREAGAAALGPEAVAFMDACSIKRATCPPGAFRDDFCDVSIGLVSAEVLIEARGCFEGSCDLVTLCLSQRFGNDACVPDDDDEPPGPPPMP
jgi:hypothetical protein